MSPKAPKPGRMAPRDWIAAALLILAAAGLRFQGLGSQGLWLDEAYTAQISKGSFSQILRDLREDDAPPLYYYAEKVVTAGVGRSEAGVRLLSALCGLAAVIAAFGIARRWRPQAGLAVLTVFGFSTLGIFYSQQARSYSLLLLLTLLLLAAALSFRARPSLRNLAFFSFAGLGLLYTHNLGFWSLLGGLLVIAPGWRDGSRARRWILLLVGVLALGSLGRASSLLGQMHVHAAGNGWMGAWWKGKSLALSPIYTFAALTNGTAPWIRPAIALPGLPEGWGPVRWLLWAGVALGLVLAIRRLVSSRPRDGLISASLLFTAAPIVGLVLTSLLVGPAYVVGRTDFLALPGFLLLIVLGWCSLRQYRARGLLLGLWVVTGAITALAPVSTERIAKGADRDLASQFGAAVRDGDALVVTDLGLPTLAYYGERQGWLRRLGWFGAFPPGASVNPAAMSGASIDSAGRYWDQALALRRLWETKQVGRIWVLAVRGTPPPKPGAAVAHPPARWPRRPIPPPPSRQRLEVDTIGFPMNILVVSMAGLNPPPVRWEYSQDWVSGDRVVLAIDRETFAPIESLPRMQVQR